MASPALEAFIDESIRLSQLKGYHPTVFIGMRERYQTIPAIVKLVEEGEIQSGFNRLRKLKLVEWSIEAAVMKFPEEFSERTRECAAFRMRLAQQGGGWSLTAGNESLPYVIGALEPPRALLVGGGDDRHKTQVRR